MAIVRCKNGHSYDDREHVSCPFCGVNFSVGDVAGGNIGNRFVEETSDAVTVAVYAGADESVTRGMDEPDNEDGVTVSLDSPELTPFSGMPVAGWLVCTLGEERGRDCRIRAGKNWIGRDADMAIVLADRSIHRKKHACVVYDSKYGRFYLIAGQSTEVELNGELVYDLRPLNDGDKIRLGASEYDFVAYCNKERVWDYEH